MSSQQASRPSRAWIYLAIFALALVVRIGHLIAIHETALFSVLLGDGRQYAAWAERIAAGNWWGDEVFYQAPLYPYFLATLIWLGGSAFWPLRLLQAFLGAASCLFLADSGSRFFTPRIGYLAGALLALYPPAIFFDSLVQKTSVALFLYTFALWLLARISQVRSWKRVLALGVVLGALVLTRENALVFIPVVGAWIILQPESKLSPSCFRQVLPMVVGLAVVLLPVGFRNQAVGGEFFLTTSQLGPNFYIGNHRGAAGVYEPLRPGREDARVEREDAVALAEEARAEKLTRGQVSEFWRDQALRQIAEHPWEWFRLVTTKARLLLNAREVVDTESIEAYADHSFWLAGLSYLLHFGIVGPLAALGLWATRKAWRRIWILYALGVATAASVVLFYVLARYRFPLVPVALLFAAAGSFHLLTLFHERQGMTLLASCLLVAAVALFQNGPLGIDTKPRATTYYNLGVACFELGRDADASRYLERTLSLLPDSAAAHIAFGRVRAAEGDLDSAAASLLRGLELDATQALAHAELARVLERQGDLKQAMVRRRAALELDETLLDVRLELAQDLTETGDWPQAIVQYQRALDDRPRNASIHMGLGFALSQVESFEMATFHLEQAIAQEPSLALAHNLLANLLAQQGRLEEAALHYETALRLDPSLGDASFKLGLVLSELGDLDAALEHLQDAQKLLPEFAAVYREMAVVLEQKGLHAAAEVARDRALELESRQRTLG